MKRLEECTTVAELLSAARAMTGIQQGQLADTTGFSSGSLSRWETGSDTISWANFKFLCDVLDVPDAIAERFRDQCKRKTVQHQAVKDAMAAFYHGTLPDSLKLTPARNDIIDRMMEDLALLASQPITYEDVKAYIQATNLTHDRRMELLRLLVG